MKKEFDDLEEFLDKAKGQITITVNGMAPHVKGNINDQGIIMSALTMIKMLEVSQQGNFNEICNLLMQLNELMGYHIVGKIPE